MKQTKTTTQNLFKVSMRTAMFLDAMQAIAAAENAVYEAMAEMYGEETQLFSQIPFDEVKKAFAEYLYLGIAENMEDKHGTEVTI